MPETPDSIPEERAELDPHTREIRRLNDQLRQNFTGGRVLMTPGINALESETITRVIEAVRGFDDFNVDNDPYQTHEFAMIEIDGNRVMFKVDAYDRNLEYASPNPADPSVTTRVLTIFLASEY